MKDLYLRFSDAGEMRDQLVSAGFNKEEGGFSHPFVSLDVIGEITYVVTEEDSTELVTDSGYHVNLRVTEDEIDLSSLDNFIVTPKTPFRVWA